MKKLTEENMDDLSNSLKDTTKFYPRGMTNIAAAMKAATTAATEQFTLNINEKLLVHKCGDYSPYRTFHLFMTDGCPTEGPSTCGGISPSVPKKIENFVIGFGVDHNEKLLNGLVDIKVSKRGGEYHFVNDFENAGVIYGTILDSIFNRSVEDVTVTVKNCEIYNFVDNTWGNTLKLGPMAFDTSRMVHLRSSWVNEDQWEICVTFTSLARVDPDFREALHDERPSTIYRVWEYNNEYTNKKIPDEKPNTAVYKYFLRQEVLELLFHVKKRTFPGQKLRHNITMLGETIKKFMETNDLNDDAFLNNLCDDLMVALHSMEMAPELGDKLCSDRHVTQGAQRAYNPATIPQCAPRYHSSGSGRFTTCPPALAGVALQKTPLFRGHTVSCHQTPNLNAVPRQVTAQRLCSQDIDNYDSDDDWNKVEPYAVGAANAVISSSMPPRVPLTRSTTCSTGDASQAPEKALVDSWIKQAKEKLSAKTEA